MANIFQKGTKFAATGIGLLTRTIKAPALFVYSFGQADFTGALGDVVNVKRPPVLKARDKGWRNDTAIVVDQINQSKIQVPLNQFPYSAVHLTPEEETLDEVDYVRDVQAPQVQALGEFYEDSVLSALAGADFVYEVVFDPSSADAVQSDPRKVALRARKYATDAHVPATGRYWIVGSSVSEAVAGHPKLLEVDASGLPEALRDGVVGKLGGWIIVELDGLAEDESYFVHETAIAKANVAPVVPKGAIGGASISANGMALTQIWDYDATNAKDRSIVESFTGAAPVLDPKVEDGAVVLVDGEPVMQFVRGIKVIFGAAPSTDSATWTIQITGTPTGGTFTLEVDGEETGPIAYNASNTDIAAALNTLEGVSGAKVTGTTTKTLKFQEYVLVALGDNSLTGGTDPDVTVTKA